MSSMGSSPLARGLPKRAAAHQCTRGIIPARAGFTRLLKAAVLTVLDHPRSRGVYDRPGYEFAQRQGSSPLARGLPVNDYRPRGRPGIIPARAGFTMGCLLVGWWRWDHPRSRGVY